MALGASRATIVSLMLRSALAQFVAGMVIGVPAALFASRMMKHLLYEISSNDPWAFVGAVTVLGVCATVAALIPAMRAASVDPIRALRTE